MNSMQCSLCWLEAGFDVSVCLMMPFLCLERVALPDSRRNNDS